MSSFFAEYIMVISLQLLALIIPGPDYVLVVSNASLQSRNHGIYTAIGIAIGIGIQVAACLFGLALIIKESPVIFETITWGCGIYLGYLGAKLLYSFFKPALPTASTVVTQTDYWRSAKQGLFCNLLNPKALLFFLSLFTLVIDERTPFGWQIAYGITMVLSTLAWFTLVSLLITHPFCQQYVQKAQKVLQPLFGVLLIGYGIIIFIY